jgi:hypothetical protein
MMTDEFESDLREALARCAADVPVHVGERLRQNDYHPRVPHRQLATGLAATVVLAGAGIAVVSLGTGSTAPPYLKPDASLPQPHSVAAIRAKLLAALVANGNDVLQVDLTTSTPSETCSYTNWYAPFDVQSGQEFQEAGKSTCTDGAAAGYATDIPDPIAIPISLPSPAQSGNLLTPGAPAVSGKAVFTGESGILVCGMGSSIGYGTGFSSGNGAYQASSVTEDTRITATPALLRSELSEGSLQLVGNTTVNGEPAIELSVVAPTGDAKPSDWGGETLWVDPSTYLPIRQEVDTLAEPFPSGATEPFPTPPESSNQVWNYTFLPSTPSNLALLQVSVPSGLPQVPVPQALPSGACSTLATSLGNPGSAGS